MSRTPENVGEADAPADHEPLQVVASDTLSLQGDVHRLVTFLNRSLKDDGYIFGLRRMPATYAIIALISPFYRWH